MASSWLMKASSSSPVIPWGLAAQSRQRYGGSTAGRNFFPASAAPCWRCASRSSRNFRNMIHVSSGNRSRSPFRPLSLRMMSRADLSSEPRAWAVVAGAARGAFALGGIELGLELGHGSAQLLRVTEQLDDLGHGAVRGQ